MPAPKRKTGLLRLIELAGTKKWWLFASMALAVVATLVQFAPTIIVYQIIRELAAHATDLSGVDRDLLWRLGWISLGAVGVFGLLLYTSSMLSHIAAFNILYEIRITLAEKLPQLSMGYFTNTASGKIKKVLSEDVEQIELFVAHHIPDITSAVVFPLLVIGYLFVVDWRLALAALIPFPIAIALMFKVMLSAESKRLYHEYHSALEKMNSAVVEYVRGMPVVKVFGTDKESFRRFKETVIAYRDWAQQMSRSYSTIYPALLTAASSSLMFIVPVAVWLLYRADDPNALIPTVLFFTLIGGGFFFPLLKLTFMAGLLGQISMGVERIDAILDEAEVPEHDSGRQPSDATITFENVAFAYDQSSILQGVSFRASPGTVTALVGPSGAGKTTIGLLTARFWDVQSGAIRIGGVDIRELKLETLMEHVSFVFQDGLLFFDTIEANIRMGNSTATMDEVIAAATAAQCHAFIERLPNGYKTLVGEGGTYLSGGEQQRIGIARAILKGAPIVVLDEATAYADPENEGQILAALARLIQNKTVLIIAHRLSTITQADQILVVNEGQIVERGTHPELVAAQGLYRRMWDTYARARQWTLAPQGAASQ
ncbi:multidrug ABC transporter [Candidatus Chloroploca asiatica]|uniref:Multidrug ABC transporter n=2 Tax=Candidatus Chloroploca asiatica TaxID=1506545 RepID=A0A2H3L9K8_9CHLR|nr:multidrug ABC transporter [Candidatus Chloroploca asiatica]